MGYGNAVADPRAAQSLTTDQTAEDFLAIQAGCVLGDEGAEEFQQTFFAAPRDPVKNTFGGQNAFQCHHQALTGAGALGAGLCLLFVFDQLAVEFVGQ